MAENTSEICSYLWKMPMVGKLQLDFKPVNISLGYHMPCRMKALNVGSPGENLLGLIPGLAVQHLEEGCSGMAGTYGLKSVNYRASLRVARKLLHRMRESDFQAGVTECSTCKMQMEQGTTKPTIHPVKLLAYAYGLMPQIRDLLAKQERTCWLHEWQRVVQGRFAIRVHRVWRVLHGSSGLRLGQRGGDSEPGDRGGALRGGV